MTTTDTTEWLWRLEAGELEVITFPVLDGDADFPVPGWTVDAKIRDRPGGATLYTWPTDLAVLSVDGLTVTLTVPGEVSAAWGFTTGWYRVRVVNPDTTPPAQEYRILQGPLIVDPD